MPSIELQQGKGSNNWKCICVFGYIENEGQENQRAYAIRETYKVKAENEQEAREKALKKTTRDQYDKVEVICLRKPK